MRDLMLTIRTSIGPMLIFDQDIFRPDYNVRRVETKGNLYCPSTQLNASRGERGGGQTFQERINYPAERSVDYLD